MFAHSLTLKLHDIDAAGTLFFGRVFCLAHDAYEEFLNSVGLGIGPLLKEGDYARVIAHAEADFLKPVFVGDKLDVQVYTEKIGGSSYTMKYAFRNGEEAVFTVKTVHVCVDRQTKKPVPVPAELRKALEDILV